jgi:hypothetical protein
VSAKLLWLQGEVNGPAGLGCPGPHAENGNHCAVPGGNPACLGVRLVLPCPIRGRLIWLARNWAATEERRTVARG